MKMAQNAAGRRRMPRSAKSPRCRTRQRLLSKALILEAALAMVKRVGVQNVSMRALSEELGVSPTAIYWHFRSQRDLIQAIVGQVYEHILAHIATPSTDWRERLRVFLRGGFDVLLQYPGMGRFMMIEGRSVPVHYQVQEAGARVLLAAGTPAAEAALKVSVMMHAIISILDWHEQVAEQLPLHSVETSVYPTYHVGLRTLDQADPHIRVDMAIRLFIASLEAQLSAASRT
jgi:TetR/AcrR family transcriptional regulator, tetracycline repressor protein